MNDTPTPMTDSMRTRWSEAEHSDYSYLAVENILESHEKLERDLNESKEDYEVTKAERDDYRRQRDRLAEALDLYAWKCNDQELANHCASSCKLIARDANRERLRRKAINYFFTN